MIFSLMELLIIHTPLYMPLESALKLENPAYSNNSTIDRLKLELEEDQIEIFKIYNNIIISEHGFYVVTKAKHVKEHISKKDYPCLYLELILKYPDSAKHLAD